MRRRNVKYEAAWFLETKKAAVRPENSKERLTLQNWARGRQLMFGLMCFCLRDKSEHISYFFLTKNLEIFRFLSFA